MTDTATAPGDHARTACLNLLIAERVCADARHEWNNRNTRPHPDNADALVALGRATMEMWAAEHAKDIAARAWQRCLMERAALPPRDRWSIAGAERYACIAVVMGEDCTP